MITSSSWLTKLSVEQAEVQWALQNLTRALQDTGRSVSSTGRFRNSTRRMVTLTWQCAQASVASLPMKTELSFPFYFMMVCRVGRPQSQAQMSCPGVSLCSVACLRKDQKDVTKNVVCMWSVKSQAEFQAQCLSVLRIHRCAVKVSSSLLPLLSSPVSAAGSSGDIVVNLLPLWCNVLFQYLLPSSLQVA